jgi:hypothetical protein
MNLIEKNKMPKKKILIFVLVVLLLLGTLIPLHLITSNASINRAQMDFQMGLFLDLEALDLLEFVILFPSGDEVWCNSSDGWSFRSFLRSEFLNIERHSAITEIVILPDGQDAASHVTPYTVVAWPSPLTYGLLHSFNNSGLAARREGERHGLIFPLVVEDLLTDYRLIKETVYSHQHRDRALSTHGILNRAYLDALSWR